MTELPTSALYNLLRDGVQGCIVDGSKMMALHHKDWFTRQMLNINPKICPRCDRSLSSHAGTGIQEGKKVFECHWCGFVHSMGVVAVDVIDVRSQRKAKKPTFAELYSYNNVIITDESHKIGVDSEIKFDESYAALSRMSTSGYPIGEVFKKR